MRDWMQALAQHYARLRAAHPDDQLLVVFDIDGTILDMRYMVCRVLHDYDRVHGSDLFADLDVDDIDVHENEIGAFLERRGLGADQRAAVLAWYLERRWAPDAVLAAHRPYRGVMEVIRWFQIQPATSVALNTGRPERLRADTLRSLNELGREYRVRFDDRLLHMNAADWEVDVAAHKVDGIRRFRKDGFRVVAVVDNEPANIAALAAAEDTEEVLFLHADTVYLSRRAPLPRTVGGSSYELTSLVGEGDLPRHVQLVWHGVNDDVNLRQFLASAVRWGEVDVRRNRRGDLVLRHDDFASSPEEPGELLLTPAQVVPRFRAAGKGVKFDVKDGDALDEVLQVIDELDLPDGDVWINGRLDALGEAGVRAVAAAHPGAIVQVPIDFLAPLVASLPEEARRVVDGIAELGVNRFSVAWTHPRSRLLLDRLEEWGHDVNLYAVPDLEQFLRAALMLPRSITADFNFPEWHYFGRGAGNDGRYHRYRLESLVTPGVDEG
ncbi:MAG TPA: hypothetical protein VF743_02065 [Acidimicrobiales bacterium]